MSIVNQIQNDLFSMVYQWGRWGIKVDSSSPAFKVAIRELELFSFLKTLEEENNNDWEECNEVLNREIYNPYAEAQAALCREVL